MENKKTTAMTILAAIEKDVNEGSFDKALYINDIVQLKGKVEELGVLKNTLWQLKDCLPQYSGDVDSLQAKIEELESDVDVMVDSEVQQSIRFNDGFNNLMDMINNRDPSRALRQQSQSSQQVETAQNTLTHRPKSLLNNKKSAEPKGRILKAGVLRRQLLTLIEQQWVTAADFERLPAVMGVEEVASKIFVLTEVGALLRLIPEEMFANDETKQNIIAAAQECLDGFIEEEADAEILGLAEVEQGFGIVGEVMADLGFAESGVNPDKGEA